MTDLFDFKRLAGIWLRERAASFPHTTQSAIFSPVVITVVTTAKAFLAGFPLILFSFFPAERALRQRSNQPGSAARSIAAVLVAVATATLSPKATNNRSAQVYALAKSTPLHCLPGC